MTPARLTILVLDDNGPNLKYARTVLESRGYAVVTVADARAAWRALADERPALILIDLHIPGVDGLTFLRELRAGAETRTIPAVMMTAYDLPGAAQHAMDAGAQAYVIKPVTIATFISVVIEHAREPT